MRPRRYYRVTIQHQPYWTQALRYSSEVTESGVTINGVGRNSDGVDLVGVSNATLADLDINVSDDNIAVKSGLVISQSDYYYSKEIGLPQMPTSHVVIRNITAKSGQVYRSAARRKRSARRYHRERELHEHLYGFHIKTGRDRGSEIYDIRVNHFTMTGSGYPIAIEPYYATVGPDPRGPAQPITPTTPHVHDITIQDLVATAPRAELHPGSAGILHL